MGNSPNGLLTEAWGEGRLARNNIHCKCKGIDMDGLKQVSLALATAGVLASGMAQAALNDRGGGMIYDDVLDITWLQDANYAKTSGYAAAHAIDNGLQATNNIHVDGRMGWDAAKTWASNLTFGGYDGWRLPTMIDTAAPGCDLSNSGTDCGYNVQTYDSGTRTIYSELAYMYYVNLALKAGKNTDDSERDDFGIFGNGTLNGVDNSFRGQTDIGLIRNLQNYGYWFGLQHAVNTYVTWSVLFDFGWQTAVGKQEELYAWAVHPGDVAPVPESKTYVMLLAGLGLLGVLAKRRRRSFDAS